MSVALTLIGDPSERPSEGGTDVLPGWKLSELKLAMELSGHYGSGAQGLTCLLHHTQGSAAGQPGLPLP